MGFYATRLTDGQEVKIGCGEMHYYCRADQAHLLRREDGRLVSDYGDWPRYRFPWPDEDNNQPGAGSIGQDYDRGAWIDIPADCRAFVDGVDHRTAEASGAKCAMAIGSIPQVVVLLRQRRIDGQLKAIVRCPACSESWRLTRAGADLLAEYARAMPAGPMGRDWWQEVSRRIVAGYTAPDRIYSVPALLFEPEAGAPSGGEPDPSAKGAEGVRFLKHHMTDGATKVRVRYGRYTDTDGRDAVIVYAKGYGRDLLDILANGREIPGISFHDIAEPLPDCAHAELTQDCPLFDAAAARVPAARDHSRGAERWQARAAASPRRAQP